MGWPGNYFLPPTARARRWVEKSVGPGAEVIRVRRLRGGTAAAMHAVDVRRDGFVIRLALRRYVALPVLEEEPGAPEREARNLQVVEAAGVAAPRPVAVDAVGAECEPTRRRSDHSASSRLGAADRNRQRALAPIPAAVRPPRFPALQRVVVAQPAYGRRRLDERLGRTGRARLCPLPPQPVVRFRLSRGRAIRPSLPGRRRRGAGPVLGGADAFSPLVQNRGPAPSVGCICPVVGGPAALSREGMLAPKP